MNKKLLINLSSLGPIGHLPAPGTWATLITVLGIILLEKLHITLGIYIIITFAVFIASLIIVKQSLLYFNDPDPKEIVLDEVVGTLITFITIPITPLSIIIGIILFRILDIAKPLGIKKLENFPGIAGIFLDDIVAGVIANLILCLIISLCFIH